MTYLTIRNIAKRSPADVKVLTALALLRAALDQSLFRATALEDPRVEGVSWG